MPKFNLSEDLYKYQKEDSKEMLSMGNCLNFSEMGVGKTPETLWIVENGNYHIPLVICPNSLKLEWNRQIDEWVGPGNCAVCSGDANQKASALVKSFQKNQKYKVMNYETLRSPIMVEMISHIPFDIIIFDEIHKLRNPETKLVKGIPNQKPSDQKIGVWAFLNQHSNATVIGLSGSPIMNYPNDLYVPLSCTRPDRFPRMKDGWRRFTYDYCLWTSGSYGSYIYGSRNLERLKEETAPYTIRRTKKEVLPDLPDKYYRRPQLEMRKDQRKIYDQMVEQLKVLLDTGEPLWSTNVLSQLTRLRQINLDPRILGVTASSAKTEFLIDTIESTDGKLVIFSCFEKYIYFLHLLFKDTPHSMITGKVNPNDRQEEVRKFQEDPEVKLCLGTIQSMGEGVTLTSASNLVIVDRWWNQPSNTQAEDRLHRIGQKNAVQIILPVVNDSIDSLLDEILERKNEASGAFYQEGDVRRTILGAL